MLTFFVCVGILGFAALLLSVGAICGFVYFGRGRWEHYIIRMVPPRVEHVDQIMNRMVVDGKLKASDAANISRELWTEEVTAQRERQWVEAQAAHRYQSAAQEEQSGIDKVRRDIGI